MWILTLVLLSALIIAGYSIFYLLTKKKDLSDNLKNIDTSLIDMSEEDAIKKADKYINDVILKIKASNKEQSDSNSARLDSLKISISEKVKNLSEKESITKEKESFYTEKEQDLQKKIHNLEELIKDKDSLQKEIREKLAGIAKIQFDTLLTEFQETFLRDLSEFESNRVKIFENNFINISEENAETIIINLTADAATGYYVENNPSNLSIKSDRVWAKYLKFADVIKDTIKKQIDVDIEIEDTKKTIYVGSQDTIRREVGTRVLARLIKEEEVTEKLLTDIITDTKSFLLNDVKKTGQYIAQKLNLTLDKELEKYLGKFKYRSSYGQNLLRHSVEVALIGEKLAYLFNVEPTRVKLACLFHDLGKIIPEEGKQHHHISAEIMRKYYADEILINAIEAHHYDIDAKYIEADIVRIADAVSGARPGARRNSSEEYLEKIKALEEIASKPASVKNVYTINAGREVRVFLDPKKSTDKDALNISNNIAKEIESTLTYPGVINVNVIRELTVKAEAGKNE